MQELSKGQRLSSELSGELVVEHRVAEGGQGVVYAVSMGGERWAVKWYFPQTIAADPRLRERLREATQRGKPERGPKFLWPIDLVACNDVPGLFGYVMPWREGRFHDFLKVVDGRLTASFRILATAGLEVAESYHRLHAAGFCYRDINFGNVALDPDTGEVRICDNDNVDVNQTPGPMAGTPGFIAPEILQGMLSKQLVYPGTRTDLWSLAVLLFYAFIRHHPLHGRAEPLLATPKAMYEYEGPNARFIFDPADETNRPAPGRHDNALKYWPIYPEFLRKLFTRAFTDGLRDPFARVFEPEWRKAMSRLRDAIMPCPRCGAENFHDADRSAPANCWSCGLELPKPLCIARKGASVVVAEKAVLFPHHVDPGRHFDFSAPVARVVRNPAKPELLGLKNLGETPWRVHLPNGTEKSVDSGKVVPLWPGLRIGFGQVQAEVQ